MDDNNAGVTGVPALTKGHGDPCRSGALSRVAFCGVSAPFGAALSEGRWSRHSARSVVRGRMVLMVARPDADWYMSENVEGQNRASISVCGCGATSPVRCVRVGAGPSFLGCRSSLRPVGAGISAVRRSNTRGQSRWRPRRRGRGQTVQRPRACCARGAHAAGLWVSARICPSRSP